MRNIDIKSVIQFESFVDYGIKTLDFNWANNFRIYFNNKKFILIYVFKDFYCIKYKRELYVMYPITIWGQELLKKEINYLTFKNQGWEYCSIDYKKNIKKEVKKYE